MKVFAYESALLFVPESSFITLACLLDGDETAGTVLLREVPAIGAVARQELQSDDGSYSSEFIGVVEFILERAKRVFASLSTHEPEPPQDLPDDGDWRQVRHILHL